VELGLETCRLAPAFSPVMLLDETKIMNQSLAELQASTFCSIEYATLLFSPIAALCGRYRVGVVHSWSHMVHKGSRGQLRFHLGPSLCGSFGVVCRSGSSNFTIRLALSAPTCEGPLIAGYIAGGPMNRIEGPRHLRLHTFGVSSSSGGDCL